MRWFVQLVRMNEEEPANQMWEGPRDQEKRDT